MLATVYHTTLLFSSCILHKTQMKKNKLKKKTKKYYAKHLTTRRTHVIFI